MAESDKSEGPLDLDTAITQVAGLLGKLDPEEFPDNEEEEEQSDDNRADESDADDDHGQDDGDDAQDADDDADVEDDEDDDEGDSDQDPWTATQKVTVDGQEIEITPKEALLGYQRQQATTRRFQEAAELKKTLNQSLEATQAEQSRLVQTLKVLEQALVPAEPDWTELRKDPARYDRERAAFLEKKEQFRQFQEGRQKAEHQAQETAKQARDSLLDEQRELLMMAIPEWVDADVMSKESSALVNYAINKHGYSKEDLGAIDDHRAYVILRKAMLYDGAKDKPSKAKGGKPNSPSLKPGSKPPRGKQVKGAKAQQKALSKFKKSGSMEDAVDAVLHMIDE